MTLHILIQFFCDAHINSVFLRCCLTVLSGEYAMGSGLVIVPDGEDISGSQCFLLMNPGCV